ncbi:MAG: FxsA family protein [Actinobacteria bacterium]|nr:FxsA family protein [Actinomycetota bacterium]
MTATPGASAQRARRTLLWILVIAFVAIPIAEFWVVTTVGGALGLWPTLALLVVSAVAGAWLMQREGAKAWNALVNAFSGGQLPTGRLADAALVLVGGILLMLPGFLTDLIGLVMILPFTRPLVRRFVAFVLARRVAATGADPLLIRGETVDRPPSDPQVIRGEIEDDRS